METVRVQFTTGEKFMARGQLYQNDPRWENSIMGFGKTETIGKLGCLLTSLTMVGNHFGGNETVTSFNEKMKQNSGFQGAWVKAFKISAVFPTVKYQKRRGQQNRSKRPMAQRTNCDRSQRVYRRLVCKKSIGQEYQACHFLEKSHVYVWD
jgi:hypothetical protein